MLVYVHMQMIIHNFCLLYVAWMESSQAMPIRMEALHCALRHTLINLQKLMQSPSLWKAHLSHPYLWFMQLMPAQSMDEALPNPSAPSFFAISNPFLTWAAAMAKNMCVRIGACSTGIGGVSKEVAGGPEKLDASLLLKLQSEVCHLIEILVGLLQGAAHGGDVSEDI